MKLFIHSKIKKKHNLFFHQQKRKIDNLLLGAIFLLCGIGLVFVYEASAISALRNFGDKFYFLKEQTIWLLFGFIMLILLSFFDYHHLFNFALPMMILAIILLIAVFVPGIGVKALGAHRWLNLKIFILQPAEAAKLALIIYLAAWFSYKEKKRLLAFLTLIGIIISLIIAEPDLGTAVIICTVSIILYFVSGAPLWHFLMLIPTIILAIVGLAITSPYRLKRIITFFDSSIDPLGASYHIRQVLLALGSGGFWGLGLGMSRQKFEYLPESMTDSIFAIIAEEIGFLGCTILIAIYLFIIFRCLRIAFFAPDRFGQLLAFGIASLISVQTIINLGAMVSLLPLTGVPLPFISYGGSNLIINLCCIGIVLNISKQCFINKR